MEFDIKPQKCFLKPGELIVSRYPCQITTILGTCVSICLFDPVTKIGGMNHYMLPFWDGKGTPSLKYGDVAITELMNKMVKKGANENAIVAKIFGGVDVINSIFQIGNKNVNVAVNLLQELGIKIKEMEVGGRKGRKISFSTWNHSVLVTFLETENYGRK